MLAVTGMTQCITTSFDHPNAVQQNTHCAAGRLAEELKTCGSKVKVEPKIVPLDALDETAALALLQSFIGNRRDVDEAALKKACFTFNFSFVHLFDFLIDVRGALRKGSRRQQGQCHARPTVLNCLMPCSCILCHLNNILLYVVNCQSLNNSCPGH